MDPMPMACGNGSRLVFFRGASDIPTILLATSRAPVWYLGYFRILGTVGLGVFFFKAIR
jgi:hypothetical protein